MVVTMCDSGASPVRCIVFFCVICDNMYLMCVVCVWLDLMEVCFS